MGKTSGENTPSPWLTVVGIGEDGLAGLGEAAHLAVSQAWVLFGGARHLAMVPRRADRARRDAISMEENLLDQTRLDQATLDQDRIDRKGLDENRLDQSRPDQSKSDQIRIEWPSPFSAAREKLLGYRGQPVVVLASGDPMFHGVGATLARWFDVGEMRVLPAASAASLAAARLGWALHRVRVIPAHREPLERVALYLAPAARLLVLSRDADTPAELAELLVARGYGDSHLVRLEHLGGPEERILEGRARDWSHPPGAALNLMAVECRADASIARLSRRAGLPDDAFAHDGQLTKRDMRAIVLARLAPGHGEQLWDVGAGCGSIGIEWLRAGSHCKAVAVESHPERCALIRANRARLGVPELDLIEGRAPDTLTGLAAPDAIFIGGGLTRPGVVDRCWEALKPGGRLVATAVTLESELVLARLRQDHGGELIRVALAQAAPLGGFQSWEPARPLTLLCVSKVVEAH
ncbi:MULTISPECIES: precorrin-6y C5,15-methyltransferase (decarboxylating) subunit CbiE [Thiorhodovibrio]|uniref:precorrin-6y C5,15-methyltransferase (decarboxylating) subunit CbiE n=1 Tax=Thiorhodovibrio TaxID=61593 RepID=UPI001914A0E5|nr:MULTISPECIES: precorrin-6y C5,15-methyltransferase (decarboxylating) subunit CbiE [Thiorhodovibrio]MBK5970692.1 cobalamin biosynthesis bifunctional protein CbiET [Thiorhodovibrio winogradskyi]